MNSHAPAGPSTHPSRGRINRVVRAVRNAQRIGRRTLIDTVGLPLTDLALRWLHRVRHHRIHRLPRTRELYARRGVFPIVDHYYEPLIARQHLDTSNRASRNVCGIEWREAAQWDLLEQFQWSAEILGLVADKSDACVNGYYLNNGYFGPGDADVYYSLIRKLKPHRIIEVGSGHSTRLASMALLRNAEDSPEHRGKLISIEPYRHPDWLNALGIEHIKEPVQSLGVAYFEQLSANDILFIDSSHMIRPQGDVLFIILEILSALASGVYVHIHDIFTPLDYPDEWLVDRMHFWNEQYLLEAYLAHNQNFEVVAALHYLLQRDAPRLERALPTLAKRVSDIGTASFWLRKR